MSGSDAFFARPILNSPYELPGRHWELDAAGQPTQVVLEARRRADFVTPIPKPKKRLGAEQRTLGLDIPFDFSGKPGDRPAAAAARDHPGAHKMAGQAFQGHRP